MHNGYEKGITVLTDVDSLSIQDLAKIARRSEVHPKNPFHSLYMHFKTMKNN